MRVGVAVVLIATSMAAQAQSTRPEDANLQAQLRQIDAAAAGIKDLSADFQQKKFMSLLKEPLISSGTVRAAGASVRWDTRQPQQLVLYADESELRLYYPDQKAEEIYSIDQRLGDLLTSPLPRLAAIDRHFTIARADLNSLKDDLASAARIPFSVALCLTPDEVELAGHVRQVIVVLDEKTGVTRAVETTDADGDRTQMAFSKIQINTGLAAGDLELQVPPGTSISHPLDAAPAPGSNPSP